MSIIVLTHNGKAPSEGGLRLGYQGGGKVFLFGGPPGGIPVTELLRRQAAPAATKAEKPPDFTSIISPGTVVRLTYRQSQIERTVQATGHRLAAVVTDMIWDMGFMPIDHYALDRWFSVTTTGSGTIAVTQKL